MADRYLEWLEATQSKKPVLKDQLEELGSLYQKRLWHQLTLALEKQIKSPAFKKDPAFLPELYNKFIIGFAYRLNPLKLAMIAEEVAREYSQASEAGKANDSSWPSQGKRQDSADFQIQKMQQSYTQGKWMSQPSYWASMSEAF